MTSSRSEDRVRREPSDVDPSTARIGELTMHYDKISRRKGDKSKYSVYSGTATLYKQISWNHFVIITAAHNLVMFESNMEADSDDEDD